MANKPEVKFATNIPQAITLNEDKPFGQWEKTFDDKVVKSYGLNVTANGVESVLFAKEALYNKLRDFKKGDTVQIIWEELQNEQGQKYHTWNVRSAIFDNQGNQPPVTPNLVSDKEARDSFRKDFKNLMYLCLKDANELAKEVYDPAGIDGGGIELTHEDIRALAITEYIELKKKSS